MSQQFNWQLINDSITKEDKKELTDFINTDDDEYRYKIGTVASQLNTVGEEIALTSNVEKYNTGTSSWEPFSDVLFQDGIVYDLYYTIDMEGGYYPPTPPADINEDSEINFQDIMAFVYNIMNFNR